MGRSSRSKMTGEIISTAHEIDTGKKLAYLGDVGDDVVAK